MRFQAGNGLGRRQRINTVMQAAQFRFIANEFAGCSVCHHWFLSIIPR
jgi:hypothetical protein